MDKPTSPARGSVWKYAAAFLLAVAVALFLVLGKGRYDVSPGSVYDTLQSLYPASGTAHHLFPIPNEPFDPDPPLRPEPFHEDDPAGRERFARLAAGLFEPSADPYDKIPSFDAIIRECGASHDRSVRAAVGAVMMLKAGLVYDRRLLFPLYDEIIMRARSMPSPHGEIVDIWARTARARLQVRRKNRQLMLDRMLEKERSLDTPEMRRALLRARLVRIEEEDDRQRRIKLGTALIADIANNHDLEDAAVHEVLEKTLSMRLAAAPTIPLIIAACDEALSSTGTGPSPVLKSTVIDAAAGSLSFIGDKQGKKGDGGVHHRTVPGRCGFRDGKDIYDSAVEAVRTIAVE